MKLPYLLIFPIRKKVQTMSSGCRERRFSLSLCKRLTWFLNFPLKTQSRMANRPKNSHNQISKAIYED